MGIAVCAALGATTPLAWSAMQAQFADSVAEQETLQRGALRWYAGKPLSGRMTLRSPQGLVLLRENYRNGLRHGLSMRWDEAGRLIAVRQYADGEKTGRHQGWWPNGTRRFDMQFVAGGMEGEARMWHANGRLARRMLYLHGQEQGPQRGWREDGRLEFAYDMRGNRRFGVIASTPCPTPAKAEPPQAKYATKNVAKNDLLIGAGAGFYPKPSPHLPFYTDASWAPHWLHDLHEPIHSVGSFSLTDHRGRVVQAAMLTGGVTVLNFFFAGCSNVCPMTIANLAQVQESLARSGAGSVRFLGVSITPLEDTQSVLAGYAHRLKLGGAWQLATGGLPEVGRLATQSFFASSITEAHTEKAYLVDDQRRIRGIYNATQPGDLLRLQQDALLLAKSAVL